MTMIEFTYAPVASDRAGRVLRLRYEAIIGYQPTSTGTRVYVFGGGYFDVTEKHTKLDEMFGVGREKR